MTTRISRFGLKSKADVCSTSVEYRSNRAKLGHYRLLSYLEYSFVNYGMECTEHDCSPSPSNIATNSQSICLS
jgi:hypothetical protein